MNYQIKKREAAQEIEDKDKRLTLEAEANKLVECNMRLFGLTAIEDKLQDQIQNTIQFI